jgi:menaquinol-cytochrome c reductase iron-sulfur subunit
VPATTAFVRRRGDGVVALRERCTHLGCPVRWVEASDRFIWVCHGAVFGSRGERLGGPARRGLERATARVVDGRFQIAWPS